ncbi:hypothetical protein SFRURICE_011225 [Spodoptera frugiperda]|nr:hypothetical protein SFRURICE_011225 [Spodoptera frugiperda]
MSTHETVDIDSDASEEGRGFDPFDPGLLSLKLDVVFSLNGLEVSPLSHCIKTKRTESHNRSFNFIDYSICFLTVVFDTVLLHFSYYGNTWGGGQGGGGKILKHRRPPSALDGVKNSSAERRVDHFSCSSRPVRSNIEPSCVSTVYLVCNLLV